MHKDHYSRSIVIDDLNPYFIGLIMEHKLDWSKMNPEIPYESNILYMLKEKIKEALGLNSSDNFYFSPDKNAIIDGDGLVLNFNNIPADKVDIKPSEFREKVKKVLEDIEKELGKEKLQNSK